MSIPRRLGRLARGFVLGLQDDERFREALRTGRERGESVREAFGEAFGAAWKGATEEWRAAESETEAEEQGRSRERGDRERRERAAFIPRRYPPKVLAAYGRLGLAPGAPIEAVHRKRRELIKRHHPDRFADPEMRARAERLAAEINGAHDTIRRHLSKG